jgi:hypothetical protein
MGGTRAYAGGISNDGDVEFGELGFGANAAEFEQLRSVERAAGDNDFFAGVRDLRDSWLAGSENTRHVAE